MWVLGNSSLYFDYTKARASRCRLKEEQSTDSATGLALKIAIVNCFHFIVIVFALQKYLVTWSIYFCIKCIKEHCYCTCYHSKIHCILILIKVRNQPYAVQEKVPVRQFDFFYMKLYKKVCLFGAFNTEIMHVCAGLDRMQQSQSSQPANAYIQYIFRLNIFLS